MLDNVKNCKLFIFDLDGVIWRGDNLLPYAKECIDYLSKNNYKIFFLTNNSTCTREEYCVKLNSYGITATKESIMTSAYATALYFKENNIASANVLVIGEEGLTKELKDIGLNIFQSTIRNPQPAIHFDYVVAGLDFEFNYNKLTLCQKAIFDGAKFIATNTDATFPTEDGILPGGGAIISAIEKATNIKPLVIGKPQVYTLEKILQITNTPPQNAVVIGDRVETDILVGKKLGTKTVLVLTGVTKKEDVDKITKDSMPDYIIENLSTLSNER
ncbi:MAG: Acid sugar phosphatase [candidate division WS2 bacterium]|nr:Acid sugar phosphatase [Candidatus Lithacetigena glycinireducens]